MANLGLTRAQINQLTYINNRVIKQKFYSTYIPDYFDLVVGEGAWSDDMLMNRSIETATDFESGFINQGQADQLLAKVNVGIDSIKTPITTFANTASWTFPQVQQASLMGKWDLIETNTSAMKRMWDQGIQQIAFLGSVKNKNITGLLNNPLVTNDITTIAKPISSMTSAEFNDFVGIILGVFSDNANSTTLPNRLVIPMDDYLGLGRAFSELNSTPRINILEEAFKKMAMEDFKILPLAYGQKKHNNLGVNRYVMYHDNIENLRMDIPVDFMLMPVKENNSGFMIEQVGVGQFSGVTVLRPQEIMYFSRA